MAPVLFYIGPVLIYLSSQLLFILVEFLFIYYRSYYLYWLRSYLLNALLYLLVLVIIYCCKFLFIFAHFLFILDVSSYLFIAANSYLTTAPSFVNLLFPTKLRYSKTQFCNSFHPFYFVWILQSLFPLLGKPGKFLLSPKLRTKTLFLFPCAFTKELQRNCWYCRDSYMEYSLRTHRYFLEFSNYSWLQFSQ